MPTATRKPPRPLRRTDDPAKTINAGKSLWQGPEVDGITFSLLSRFLVCRERFRLKVVEGLVEDEGFKHALHYGSMWHECEEANAGRKDYKQALSRYVAKLLTEYPTAEKKITEWSSICATQFPVYLKHWKGHSCQVNRRPLLEEVAFRVPYTLPSGRIVTLRGKFDAVYSQGKGIWLNENKTKGEIDEQGLQGTVDQNLQSMIYQTALRTLAKNPPALNKNPKLEPFLVASQSKKIEGTLYNVVRRPLADRFAIRQKKKESWQSFLKRLGESIEAKAEYFFMRWQACITDKDVAKFQAECLNPILEGLCDWWEFIRPNPFNPWDLPATGRRYDPERNLFLPYHLHWRTPFGIYNSLAGGFRGDYWKLITTGSNSGLTKTNNLFPELT